MQVLMMRTGTLLRDQETDLVAAARNEDEAAVRMLIQRHNRMLFRLARSVLPTDDEAEDAVQAAYVQGFTKLHTFRGEAGIGTWLGRIVLNEALGRARRMPQTMAVDAPDLSAEVIPFPLAQNGVDPERSMAQRQIGQIVERAIDGLPLAFRTVLVARLIEELSVEQTAALLDLRPETVKTRLHRARALLRKEVERQIGAAFQDAFPFGGERCRRMADRVVSALQAI